MGRVHRGKARTFRVPCMEDSLVLEEEDVPGKQMLPKVQFVGKTEEWLIDHPYVETKKELHFHMFVQLARRLKIFCSVQCPCLHFCPWPQELAQGHP